MKDPDYASNWIASSLYKFRYVIWVILLGSIVASIRYVPQLEFDFSPEALLVTDDSEVARRSHAKFGRETRTIIVAIEATGDRDIFSPECLNWQYQTQVAFAKNARILKLKSLATLRVPESIPFLRSKKLVWLFGSKNHDQDSADRFRQRITQGKQFEGLYYNSDMSCTGIFAFLRDEDDKINEIAEIVQQLKNVLKDNPAPEGYRVHLSGVPYLRVKIIDQLKNDQIFLLPIAGCFLGIVMVILFRCLGAILLPLAALGLGLLWDTCDAGRIQSTDQYYHQCFASYFVGHWCIRLCSYP